MNQVKKFIAKHGWKTISGAVLVGVSLVDKQLFDLIPDTVSNSLFTIGAILVPVGIRHAITKMISEIKNKVNP